MRRRHALTGPTFADKVAPRQRALAVYSKYGIAIHVHNDTPAESSALLAGLIVAVPALALASLLVALVEPRSTPGLFALLALPIMTLAVFRGQLERSARLLPLEIVALVFGLYLAVNASWSIDRTEAYGKVAIYFLFATLVSLVVTALPALDTKTATRLRQAIVLAVLVGAVFLAIESAFDQPIKRTVASLLPLLRPPKKHTHVENGWVTEIGLYVLNRNMAVLSALLWSTLLLMRETLRPALSRIIGAALLVTTAIAVFRSEHETSMIALVFSCLVFAGFWVTPRAMRVLVAIGWITATLLIVPLAAQAYSAKLYQAEWIPKTGRNRIVLWGVTAAKVAETPILGIGIESTKPLFEESAATAAWPKDHPYPLRTGRHSHNIYMQTWFELGAVGACLLLALGLLVLRAFSRLAEGVQPYAYAGFVSVAVIGAFSWGMWQPWFMATFGLWGVVWLIAADAARRRGEP